MTTKVYKIVIDTMGSDKGPEVIVEGAVRALASHDDLSVILVGDRDIIEKKLSELSADTSRVEVIGTSDVITNYDSPMEAIFKKTDSSLVVAAILPAERGGFVCLVDTGANIDCTPSQLHAFATMGAEFMRSSYGIESPKIGLLSNGVEQTKGNKLVKETHALLKADESLNFVGNLEGTNALSGDCDVLVADGFAGNQVLKNSEGIARRIITDIVKYSKATGNPEIMKLVGYLMSIYDFNSLGGGIVLGIRKPIIKAHGAANADSITNTSAMLLNIAKNNDVFYGKDNR